MKSRRLATILTSAYLSAMLASSVAPIRSSATFAAAVDPLAAQKALQNAMNGLNAAGWAPASASTPVAVPPVVIASSDNPPPKPDPVMTEELMARLIKYTRSIQGTGTVTARICKVLDLCDGTKDMPLKLAKSDSTDGIHYFGLPLDVDSRDILIMVKHNTVVEAYLTDKTATLRAAAVLENGTAHLITNERAAEKFKAELSLFAGEAATLPPTGNAATGNS